MTYAAAYNDVLRFIQRRVDVSHAEDIAAEITVRDPVESAYASWTAYPTGITADVEGPAAATCREWWSRPLVADMGRSVEETELEPIMAGTRGGTRLCLARAQTGMNPCASRRLSARMGKEGMVLTA